LAWGYSFVREKENIRSAGVQNSSASPEKYEIKEILQLIDEEPIVLTSQLKFWEWIAEYYMCTIGEVMKAALPAALKMESDTYVSKTDYDEIELSDNEQIVVHLLDSKKK
jgi:primosomal protein N' (replication factor Y)